MARGHSLSDPDSILYGAAGPRGAALPERPWRLAYPDLNPDTVGTSIGWFEGYSGWSGTGSWMVRAEGLPEDWVRIEHENEEMAPEETIVESIHHDWGSGQLQEKLRPCQLQEWAGKTERPMIACSRLRRSSSEHEDEFTVLVRAGFMAAMEAVAREELEYPERARWMVEEHGWSLSYVDADQEVFGVIFLNGEDGGLSRV